MTARTTKPFVFWNILGSVALGFAGFVLTSNLAGMVWSVAVHPADSIWEMLTQDSIPAYGVILVGVPLAVVALVGRRSLARRIMDYRQILAILGTAAAFALTLTLI